MKKKLTSVLLFLALSAGVVSAQTSKVTGKVIGEDGEPVIGASIIVKEGQPWEQSRILMETLN